jgi:hypothetical protein
MPSVIMLSHNAECHYAECHYAESHNAECHGAQVHIPSEASPLNAVDEYSRKI